MATTNDFKKTYFLGYSTPNDFNNHLKDDIESGEFTTYIIKGGPGTGKSSMMKKIASMVSDLDEPEIYYCSSDPNSLDAVLFDNLKVIIADGTAPHVIEPTYPGAREVLVDLGECWNLDSLSADKNGIIDATNRNLRYHALAKKYLSAIISVNEDIMSIGDSALDCEKLGSYCERLSAKLFPKKKSPDHQGKIKFRQMTSFTPDGVKTFNNLFENLDVYKIEDDCFSVTDKLLKQLAGCARDNGYDVLISKNVFLSGSVYQHMIIPEIGTDFVSGVPLDTNSTKINAMRFYDKDILRDKHKRLMFDEGIVKELTDEMISALRTAKDIHDELESYYIKAMDFDKVNSTCEQLIERIRNH
ncbi:MAG: hypothetical protein LUC38_06810 [Oscillospiraceae bacterium]|nr:hypothetical protein [Ruminococcus sp.]MCD8345653.1 hypothetical protein [Oscillospiraceae bacterium]